VGFVPITNYPLPMLVPAQAGNQLPVSSIACPTKPRAKAEESSFHQRDTRYCPYCHPGPRAGIHKKVCEALPPTRYQILSLLSSRPTSRDPEKQPAKRFQPRDTRYCPYCHPGPRAGIQKNSPRSASNHEIRDTSDEVRNFAKQTQFEN